MNNTKVTAFEVVKVEVSEPRPTSAGMFYQNYTFKHSNGDDLTVQAFSPIQQPTEQETSGALFNRAAERLMLVIEQFIESHSGECYDFYFDEKAFLRNIRYNETLQQDLITIARLIEQEY